MIEHSRFEPRVEFAQQGNDPLRRLVFGHAGKADDIGEQHRDRLSPHDAQRLVRLGQLVDDPRREIAGEIGALARRSGLANHQATRSPHTRSRNACDEQQDDHVLGPDVEVDEPRIEMLREELVGRHVGVMIERRDRARQAHDQVHAQAPRDRCADTRPNHELRRIAQRDDRDEDEEIHDRATAQHHLWWPDVAKQQVVAHHREGEQSEIGADHGVAPPDRIMMVPTDAVVEDG